MVKAPRRQPDSIFVDVLMEVALHQLVGQVAACTMHE